MMNEDERGPAGRQQDHIAPVMVLANKDRNVSCVRLGASKEDLNLQSIQKSTFTAKELEERTRAIYKGCITSSNLPLSQQHSQSNRNPEKKLKAFSFSRSSSYGNLHDTRRTSLAGAPEQAKKHTVSTTSNLHFKSTAGTDDASKTTHVRFNDSNKKSDGSFPKSTTSRDTFVEKRRDKEHQSADKKVHEFMKGRYVSIGDTRKGCEEVSTMKSDFQTRAVDPRHLRADLSAIPHQMSSVSPYQHDQTGFRRGTVYNNFYHQGGPPAGSRWQIEENLCKNAEMKQYEHQTHYKVGFTEGKAGAERRAIVGNADVQRQNLEEQKEKRIINSELKHNEQQTHYNFGTTAEQLGSVSSLQYDFEGRSRTSSAKQLVIPKGVKLGRFPSCLLVGAGD